MKRVFIGRASYKGSEPVVEDALCKAMFLVGRETDWKCTMVTIPRRTAQLACNMAIAAMERHEDECGERYTHVVYLDDDVIVRRDTIIRLVDLVDIAHPAVFSLGFFRGPPHQPAIFRGNRMNGKVTTFTPILEFPANDWLQVDAAGLCAAAFDREIFSCIERPYFDWGMEGKHAKQYTPDGYLCNRLADAGIRMHCHTGVRVGHLGEPVMIDERYASRFKDAWPCGAS